MKKKLLYILLFFITLQVTAQDIHFSQFFENPQYVNPALTGNFDGDYRMGGIYHNQWQSVTKPFRTFSFFADGSELLFNKKFSPGVYLSTDRAGDSKLSTLELNFSGSYKIFQDKDSVHSIHLGINLGLTHRSINYDDLKFDNQYNGFYYDPSLNTGETFQKKSYSNLNTGLGITYQYTPEQRKSFLLGFSLQHINGANQSFDGEKLSQSKRWSVLLQGNYPISENIDILPALFIQQQEKYNESILGARGKYYTHSFPVTALYFGAYYRNKDALFIETGMDYKQWHGSLSYDFNTSSLHPASNYRGGIEIALSYIFSTYNPKYIFHEICPDYL